MAAGKRGTFRATTVPIQPVQKAAQAPPPFVQIRRVFRAPVEGARRRGGQPFHGDKDDLPGVFRPVCQKWPERFGGPQRPPGVKAKGNAGDFYGLGKHGVRS